MEDYNLYQWMVLTSILATIISGISAAIAVYFSKRSIRAAQKANDINKSNFDLELKTRVISIREEFIARVLQIRDHFPKSIEKPLSECTEDEKKALNSYWEIVFSEYYTCKNNVPEIQKLWEKEYRKHALRALKWRSFRESLIELIDHKRKTPSHKEIIMELKQIMKEAQERFLY